MKKNIELSVKEIVFIFIFFVLVIVLLVQVLPNLINLLSSETSNRLSAYINVIGNITGGLIGGIVAYLVASYQVVKTKVQDEQNQLKKSYSNLLILKNELEYNFNVLDSLNNAPSTPLEQKIEFLRGNLTTEQWSKASLDFVSVISIDLFNKICGIYRNIGFIRQNKSTVNLEFIANFEKILSETIKELKDKITYVNNKIKEV